MIFCSRKMSNSKLKLMSSSKYRNRIRNCLMKPERGCSSIKKRLLAGLKSKIEYKRRRSN